MADRDERLLEKFARLAASKNFLSFDELTTALGISAWELIRLKPDLEERLREEDDKVRLVSRMDLEPPGFYIES